MAAAEDDAEELPGAFPPARGVVDGAGPAAGAGLVPAAVPATAGQDPAPTPVPSPARHRERRPSPRPGPAPGPSLALGAVPLHPTEGPGPGPRASPSHLQIMAEGKPHRYQTTDEDSTESVMKSKTSNREHPVHAMISWCQRLLLYLVLEASCLSLCFCVCLELALSFINMRNVPFS